MWSSFHGAVGATIAISSPDPVLGLGAAFVSHFVADYIGETGYKSNKQAALYEGSLLLLFALGAYLSGEFWLAVAGWIFANLPDLIDKPRRILFGKKEWFSCHNGVGLFQYKGKKLGYPVQIRLTRTQTIALNVIATVLWVIL